MPIYRILKRSAKAMAKVLKLAQLFLVIYYSVSS
jgi:hypothetical protein